MTRAAVTTTVLGLDLGTSQLKAVASTPDGTVLARASAGYRLSAPRPGWAEAEPEDWWRAARTAVRSMEGPALAEVCAIAITGQMHGVVLVTERAVVLRPAIVWLDRRAAAQAGAYRRLSPGMRERLGNAPSPGMAGPLLLWLSANEPGAYRKARWMLQPKDWLRLRLTGKPGTDPTDASGTLLFDLGRGTWAADAVAALGLRAELLPPVAAPAHVAGTLRSDAAAGLGLRPGLPVATGAADTAASLLAAGLPEGWGLLTLGTGGQWIVPAAPTARADGSGRTNLFCSVNGGAYRLAGAQNVGAALDWVRRTLGATWDELYATAARPWQQAGPVFLPYLAGERGDEYGPGGTWAGLALAHRRDDLMRAALEGVAFGLRSKLDDLRAAGVAPQQVQLGGGGSRNQAWRTLLAGALAVPLHPAGDGWLTARGAAMIAAAAAGYRETAVRPAEKPAEKSAAVPGAAPEAEQGYRRFRSWSAAARQDPAAARPGPLPDKVLTGGVSEKEPQ
ncbi:MAG: sugar kinase [Streptosporangiaceae bacterium]|nr:sugar kinase [Streptosporangiaceae bacterium]